VRDGSARAAATAPATCRLARESGDSGCERCVPAWVAISSRLGERCAFSVVHASNGASSPRAAGSPCTMNCAWPPVASHRHWFGRLWLTLKLVAVVTLSGITACKPDDCDGLPRRPRTMMAKRTACGPPRRRSSSSGLPQSRSSSSSSSQDERDARAAAARRLAFALSAMKPPARSAATRPSSPRRD